MLYFQQRLIREWLGKIGDAGFVDMLTALLQAGYEDVHRAAEGVLAEIRSGEFMSKPSVDLRDDEEREIESHATAGESLGPKVDLFVDELIQIGRTDGYRPITHSVSQCPTHSFSNLRRVSND